MSDPDAGPVDGLALGGDPALPFVSRHEDGSGDPSVLVKPRAIQCALSRICGVCGLSLVRPIALVGTAAEADASLFAFPPCHEQCAVDLARHQPGEWTLVRTAAFDLIRPTRRGEPVAFRATAVIDRVEVTPDLGHASPSGNVVPATRGGAAR